MASAVLMLAGCGFGVSEKGVSEKTASEVFGDVVTVDQRLARLCLTGAGFSEAVAFISERREPLFAPQGLAAVERIVAGIERARDASNLDWIEVEIFYVKLELYQLLRIKGESTAKKILQPGVDLMAGLELLTELDLAAHVIRDIRKMVADMTLESIDIEAAPAEADSAEEPRAPADVQASCDSRLAFNLTRLRRAARVAAGG